MNEHYVRIEAAIGKKKLATFTGTAYTGGKMRVSGWANPIVIDLDGVEIPSQHRPVLRQHDHAQLLGHTTAISATPRLGIPVEGVFSGQPEHTRKVVDPGLNGFPWQLSIGADPLEVEQLDRGEGANVNGRGFTGPLTIMRRTQLGEISFVPLGADDKTSASVNAKNAPMLLRCAKRTAGSREDSAGLLSSTGIAMKFSRRGIAEGEFRGGGRAAVSVQYAAAAFEQSLDLARVGQHEIGLTLKHDGPRILSTRTGMFLFQSQEELHVGFRDTHAARAALSLLDLLDLRALSVGVREMQLAPLDLGEGTTQVVVACELYEIAAVADGGIEGAILDIRHSDLLP